MSKLDNGVVSLKTQSANERRLLRLTWNDNQWEFPSGRIYDPKKQGRNDVAYENQYGFGFEEWLFNPRYQLDGFQYGYIRGIENVSSEVEIINEAYLFTIAPDTKDRSIIGILKDVEIIKGFPKEEKKAKKLFKTYFTEMKEDLKTVGADEMGLNENDISNIRFKIEGNQLFEKPIIVPGLKIDKYNRFQPYIIDSGLDEIFKGYLPAKDFVFNPRISKNRKQFERSTITATTFVARTHGTITDEIITYLKNDFSVAKQNISVETTTFGSNIADVILKHPNGEITIMEVKTGNNTRKNIREALGQLLDYAFWYEHVKIKNLVIVSPSFLDKRETDMLNRIKSNFKIDISYWQYTPNAQPKDRIKVIL